MSVSFDCRHRYGDGFALDAKFDAGDGVTAVCGASGSGKTTVLMLVAGLLRPADGRIALGGRVLVDTAAGVWVPPHRREVGVVFQDALLFPHRSVRANLTYGLERRPARPLDFDHVVEVLELGGLLGRRPGTLSGGQARRVAIGRALLRGPELLMLDEPWVGLDEPMRDRVVALVRRCIAEWRIPTLLVSHDRRFVRAMADQVVELAGGRLRKESGDAPDAVPSPLDADACHRTESGA